MIELDSTDLRRIQGAIREWKGDPAVAESFDSGRLKQHVDRWAAFVRTDWANWDVSEYDHDLGARYWIQLVLENCSPPTCAELERIVAPADAEFRGKMAPTRSTRALHQPFREGPYFWETHSIHPDLSL